VAVKKGGGEAVGDPVETGGAAQPVNRMKSKIRAVSLCIALILLLL
jgi:hypothetical protein